MTGRRPMTVSPLWLQGSILTFVIGFSLLTFSAIRIYQDHAPIPERIVDEAGNVLFTRQQILDGQEQFLTYGLMQFGTVYGHGAYLGPDFTADYLHRMAVHMNKRYGDDEAARGRTRRELQANRYDPKTGTLVWTDGQVSAFEEIHDHFGELVYGRKVSGEGLKPGMITDAEDTRAITSFIAWTAWTGVARRPGKTYSYTNNWPPEELVGNTLTGDAIMWSTLSLVTLLGGSGLVLGLYGRHSRVVGWHETEERQVRFVPPCLRGPDARPARDRLVLPGRRGALPAPEPGRRRDRALHGRDRRLLRDRPAEVAPLQPDADLAPPDGDLLRGDGLPGRRDLPRAADRRPRAARPGGAVRLAARRAGGGRLRQPGRRVPELPRPLAARAAVVLRAQGWEYLELGRFWMYLLIIGMVLWVVIIYRGLRPRLAVESRGNLPWLFLYSSLSIPAFYAVGLLTHTQSTFAIGDFWRFWVVHLWVEDFLELFTTMLVALIFVLMGIVSERFATRLIYFDVMLYSIGGVVGTLHHCYFSGGPAVEMALGAFFSAAEVIPLTLADGRGLVVPPARQPPAGRRRGGVPAPLGGPVPGLGRVLELPRRGGLRVPDQHAGRELLRDRHAAHLEPRPRGLHGRLWHARPRTPGLLHAVPRPARGLERGAGAVLVLGDERRA